MENTVAQDTKMAEFLKVADQVAAEYAGRRGSVIPVLQKVQDQIGYLPPEVMQRIGERLGVPPAQIFGVASFYAQFRFVKPGEHMIKVCLGTACHVCGAGRIVDALERELNIKEGETTKDDKFSFESVRCFGSCALAPVLVVDDEVYGNVTGPRSLEILKKYQ